jgi:hypothetical protein
VFFVLRQHHWEATKRVPIAQIRPGPHYSHPTHHTVHFASVLRHLEGNLDVTLCRKVVNLVWANFAVGYDKSKRVSRWDGMKMDYTRIH